MFSGDNSQVSKPFPKKYWLMSGKPRLLLRETS